MTLSIDTDGDGTHDAWLHGHVGSPGSLTGCPTGTWNHHGLLDGAARFEQLGGGWPVTDIHSAHAAAGPDHQVLRALVIYDGTWLQGPSNLYLDNLSVSCFTLGELVDVAHSLAAGATGC